MYGDESKFEFGDRIEYVGAELDGSAAIQAESLMETQILEEKIKSLEEKQRKLEAALQEAERGNKYKELQTAMEAVDDVLGNIAVLNNVANEAELERMIPEMLASLGKYSMSDRAYLFAWASEERRVLRMTHEWCREGVEPTIDQVQDVKMSDLPNWTPRLNRGESIVSMDWEEEGKSTPQEYRVFDGQDIHALIVIPIFSFKKLNGYIGFDNPDRGMTALSVRMLSTVGIYIGGLKENLFMMEELEKKQDSLQGSLEELNREKKILDALIIDYTSVFYCDLTADTMIVLKQGDYTNAAVAEKELTDGLQSYSFRIRYYFENYVIQESAPDFMKKLSAEYLKKYLKHNERFAYRFRAKPNLAGQQCFEVQMVRLAGTDGFKAVMGYRYIDDIVEEQEQQKIQLENALADARRANMAKTDFLRRMSHDIRTPINGIQGMVEIAEHFEDDKEKQKECRDKVKEASGFLLDLVNSILDMNKLESGAVVLEHCSFDLMEVLRETNNIIEMNGEMKGLCISMDQEKIRHTRLLGSPVHLKQVLQNVAGNAVKYNRKGGSVSLSTEEISCGKGTATYRFICSDTGRGMSEAFLEHVFEPFVQEEPNARTSYMGTGLGLAIAKQLVEMMGGTIEVTSRLGKGTTFTLVIPFETDTVFEEKTRKEQEISDDVLKGVNVLLAEDNALNQEIAEFMLKNAGMNVTTAQNGKEAVELFAASEEGGFDLILMDIMMPVLDGLEAAKKIRGMERPDARQIPIFAMTANAFVEDVEQSKAAGMNEHLSKPLEEKKMLRAIKRYMAGRL